VQEYKKTKTVLLKDKKDNFFYNSIYYGHELSFARRHCQLFAVLFHNTSRSMSILKARSHQQLVERTWTRSIFGEKSNDPASRCCSAGARNVQGGGGMKRCRGPENAILLFLEYNSVNNEAILITFGAQKSGEIRH